MQKKSDDYRKRYGAPTFRNMYVLWLGVGLLGLMILGAIILRGFGFALFYCALLLFFLCHLLVFRQSYRLCADRILARDGKHIRQIDLPEELVVVIGYAQVPGILGGPNDNFFLKREWSVSILKNVSVQVTLEKLHARKAKKYTNLSVENNFHAYTFLYSYLGDQDALDALLQGRRGICILPASLAERVKISKCDFEVIVDAGY